MTIVSHRVARLVIGLAVITLLVAARDLAAQVCGGNTAYLVRDEVGTIMSAEQMKGLRVRSVNGIALQLRTDSGGTESPYFAYDRFEPYMNALKSEPVAALSNPLLFRAPLVFCGRIGDLTLTYAGKTMRLRFDIEQHNAFYEIDALPFQDGTFRLQSLKCGDNAQAPTFDDRTPGKCRVAADAWKRVERASVGHLAMQQLAGGLVDSTASACRSSAGRQLEAITTQLGWDTVWVSYPSISRGNVLPKVDFTTQFVLVVYGPTFDELRTIQVDTQGNLTRERQQGLFEPNQCLILFLAVDRSGVRSIAGRPLRVAPPR